MKKAQIFLALSWLVLNSAPLAAAPQRPFSRLDAYDENGWVKGFAHKRAEVQVPDPGEPVSAEEETGQDYGEPAEQPAGQLQDAPGQEEPTGQPAETPAQTPAEDAKESLLPPDFDAAKADRLAEIARRNNAGHFLGRCYEFVANFMEWGGIIKPWQWSWLGIGPWSAADFATWANAHPAAMRKHISMARIQTPEKTADLPVGGVVVYQRGACGFSSRHGHIEVVVSPDRLCSDGCQPAYQACFSNPGIRSRISVYVPVKNSAKEGSTAWPWQ